MKPLLKYILSAVSILYLSTTIFSQEIEIVGDIEYFSNKQSFDLLAPQGADLYYWTVPQNVDYQQQGHHLIVVKCPNGRHTFKVTTSTINFEIDWKNKTVKKDTVTTNKQITVIVGEIKPEPGPKPDPEPKPDPDPEPKPDPAIIDAEGLHVLIIYESKEKKKLSQEHFNTIFSMNFRDFLKGVCTSDNNAGDGKAYRIWDKDENVQYAEKKWREAFPSSVPSIPWIIVSNKGVGSFSGPMPETMEKTKTLISKFGE